ncbi:MAG: type IV pilus biogenesis/stability protein PilW [Aquabacterium sp.]|nr:type IV pilus biogenesis/stability protein PilW [Aquabacterium sp.]
MTSLPGMARGLALLAAALLGACAGGPGGTAANQPTSVLTASDQTDQERRARVRLELATAYFGRGQLETALDETKLAMQVKPDMAEAFNLRAMIYAAMGENRLAEDSFARALQLSPRDGPTLHNQAWFLCQQGQFATAQARFDTLLAQPEYRDQARSLLARGVCYGRDGKYPDAEAALMRAYELEPANPSIGVNLSEVLLRRGAYERASFYIGRINESPDATNAQTLWLAARIERRLGRDAAVRVLGDRLRQRFSQSPEAALFERGRFDD